MRLGDLELGHTFLAPMAGVADLPFRRLCRTFGADLAYSEMVSAKALHFMDKKTCKLLDFTDEPSPHVVQLFGHEPEIMAEAAVRVSAVADIIDINMGCPAPKITGGGDGSALMKNPALAGEIVRAVSSAVAIPVTVKIRKGWEENTAVAFALELEQQGAAAIAVHGRTAKEQYAGRAERAAIAAVKRALSIPVIANGDISDAADALAMERETGCDAVMIGRGALGNPFLFRSIRMLRETGEAGISPTVEERLQTALHHIAMLTACKGEHIGVLEARKHAAWYIKGFRGASAAKERINRAKTYAEMEAILLSLREAEVHA